MDLTHLQREGDLQEVSQEAIEQRQRRSDLMLPEECRGQARVGDDVGEPAEAHIDMDAGRVQNPFPLPSSAVWLDEENLSGKAPGRCKILLRLLTAALEMLEVAGEVVGKVASEARIADERVDV